MKKPLTIIAMMAVTYLLTAAVLPEALAIDVYHLLVQYKNGRVVEKVTTRSEQQYKRFFEGYVANVASLGKKEYSLHQFIQTFGKNNYYRFMTGHFGFGLEEKIILQRNAGGLGANPLALPPPDKRSKLLGKKLSEILQSSPRDTEVTDPIDQSTLSKPAPPLPAQRGEPVLWANGSLERGEVALPGDLLSGGPKESDEKEGYGPKIVVYRFSAEYTNGNTVEKISAEPPEKYRLSYKQYVSKVALVEKQAYTLREFKKIFGEKNRILLIQGLFGKDDIDIVMDNRIKRGLAPDQSVLPTTSRRTASLAKQ